MHTVKNILDPQQLVLTWRAPKSDSGTNRYKVAQLDKIDDQHVKFFYLTDCKDFKEARRYGFEGFPAFEKFDNIYEQNVLEVFMRRTPPRKREDFSCFLEQIGVDPNISISNFTLLGYSGAKLATDTFELVDVLDNIKTPGELILKIAGVRYYVEDTSFITIDDKVELEHDSCNKYDPNAIMVKYKTKTIGYINRFQCEGMRKQLSCKKVDAYIHKINGTPDKPRILLFTSFSEQ